MKDRISRRSAPYPSHRSYGRAQNCWIATSFTTILYLAEDSSSADRNAAFCTEPSIVRDGSLIASRHPGGGEGGRPRAVLWSGGSVGTGSSTPVGYVHAAVASALRHDRSSGMMRSTAEPQWNTRNSGSPARAGSVSDRPSTGR